MLRRVSARRMRSVSLPSRRHLHSAPSHAEFLNSFIESVANKSVAFHDLFHHVHHLTGFPLITSIPIATILIRSLVTPFRYHYARQRQQQREVAQKLELEVLIINKQAENRLTFKKTTVEDTEQWKKSQWTARRYSILKNYPLSEPTICMSPDSRFDITNIYAMALVAINTSSLLALNHSDPSGFELDMLQGMEIPLSLGFWVLAVLNTYYFRPLDLVTPSYNPFSSWTMSDFRALNVLAMPGAAAYLLAFCPLPVVVSALSSSTYTLFERRLIEALTSKNAAGRLTQVLKTHPIRRKPV